MFARIASLTLIAAIVACPLLCGNEPCSGCCAEVQVARSTCLAGGTEDCCCETTSQEGTSHDGERRRPCDDSGESGCQGVCGGAVLDKPNSLPAHSEIAFLHDFSENPTPAATRLADRRCHAVESRFDGSMNPGRRIRTLHQSLLL